MDTLEKTFPLYNVSSPLGGGTLEVGDVPDQHGAGKCFSLMTSIYRSISPRPIDPASTPIALGTESVCAVPAGWKIPVLTYEAIFSLRKRKSALRASVQYSLGAG